MKDFRNISQFGKNMEPEQALRIFNSCEQVSSFLSVSEWVGEALILPKSFLWFSPDYSFTIPQLRSQPWSLVKRVSICCQIQNRNPLPRLTFVSCHFLFSHFMMCHVFSFQTNSKRFATRFSKYLPSLVNDRIWNFSKAKALLTVKSVLWGAKKLEDWKLARAAERISRNPIFLAEHHQYLLQSNNWYCLQNDQNILFKKL